VVAAWPAGPLETRVALDRPAAAATAKALVGTTIPFDVRYPGVAPWHKAGAPVAAEPRGRLHVTAARLEDAGRTLVLTTDPHPAPAVYLLALPLPGQPPASRRTVPYDLCGVVVRWEAEGTNEKAEWDGWWPEIDSRSSRRTTQGSVEHERGFGLLGRPGRLTLSTLVTLPRGRAVLQLEASAPIEAALAGENAPEPGKTRVRFAFDSTGEPTDLFVTVPTGGGQPFWIRATYQAGEAPGPGRPLEAERQWVGWAPPLPSATAAAPEPPPFELAGGDRRRGEVVFYGDQAKCSACHAVRGKGAAVGPDLTAQAGRPLREVYRDIAEPSAAIHPEFVPYTVALKDGRVLVGVVRAEGANAIKVTDTEAKTTTVKRDEVEELRPSGTSIMPVGLAGAIGEEKVRDLLAFLTSAAPASTPQAPAH
jgi:putative heme-binding domain-containing protein